MQIVMAGCAGLKGAAKLSLGQEEMLEMRFPRRFREHWTAFAEAALREEPALPEDAFSLEAGTFQALWMLGESTGKGLTVSLAAIPVDQRVIEIAEALGENPYRLPGTGYIAVRSGKPGDGETVIGYLTENKARIVEEREGIRYLTKPEREI